MNLNKYTFKTPAYPPCKIPSSITSRHATCCGILGVVSLAFCLATLIISYASDREPILSMLWRDRTHGLRFSAISNAHCLDTFSNSWGGTIASMRPSFFPSSESIGLDVYRKKNSSQIFTINQLSSISIYVSFVGQNIYQLRGLHEVTIKTWLLRFAEVVYNKQFKITKMFSQKDTL